MLKKVIKKPNIWNSMNVDVKKAAKFYFTLTKEAELKM